MSKLISITSQGQVTIPSKVRKQLNISGRTQAIFEVVDGALIIKPQNEFWSLAGSLGTGVHLTDREMRLAREQFTAQWLRQ